MLISVYRHALRATLYIYLFILKALSAARYFQRKPIDRNGLCVLLTGTFYSDQWIDTHLRPLAYSRHVDRVIMVACRRGPDIEGVEYAIPPKVMRKFLGEVPSRLIFFCFSAFRIRPDVIGGFHILLNGLIALMLSRILGSRSLYVCGGGPREVEGGGYLTENRIFKRIGSEDKVLEHILIKLVNYFDVIAVMGQRAVEYFRRNGVSAPIYIQPGGFNAEMYCCADSVAEYDLIFIGRISRVKRIDIFIDVLNMLKSECVPGIKAVVVGDGPERPMAEELCKQQDLEENVHFVGWQSNVSEWLQKSKIFVMTSESEGLSQALIQAMMCGLPSVVSNVGDLADLVSNNENGFLINNMDKIEYANKINMLLSDSALYDAFRKASIRGGSKYKLENAAGVWDEILQTSTTLG